MNQPERNPPNPCDLGELALALVFRSVGYALLALIATAVAVMLGSIAEIDWIHNQNFWPITVVVWAGLQAELLARLRRLARRSPHVVSSNRTIHKLELCAAGFLFLFWLARPYLIESDASSYPYLQRLFQLLIGLTAFYHLLVLAVFRTKPTRWDATALLASAAAALALFLR